MAACLAAGPRASASFRSAAQLHTYPGVAPPGGPEITVYGDGSRRLDGVVGHRSDLLHPADLCTVHGVPTTSPARTIVDLGRYVSGFVLGMTLDYAKRRHLCSYEDVAECLERIGGRGRPGTAHLRSLLPPRLTGRICAGDSGFEVRVSEAMIAGCLPPFVQQLEVAVDGRVFFIDIASPEQRVGIEVMGMLHSDPGAPVRDADRANLLTRAGWMLYEAWPGTDLARLATLVRGAIARR